MSTTAEISEPANELERLIAELSGSGLQGVFVFGVDCHLAHLADVTTPVFRGPADRRWWHFELSDDAASRTIDVQVDEVTGVRFGSRADHMGVHAQRDSGVACPRRAATT